MPPVKDLVESELTVKHWLVYYKNVWTRNLIARTVDLQGDIEMAAKNPTEVVLSDDQTKTQTVTERIENRKMLVQDALNVVQTIGVLLDKANDQAVDFLDMFWSEKALAPATAEVKETGNPADVTPPADLPPASEKPKDEPKA